MSRADDDDYDDRPRRRRPRDDDYDDDYDDRPRRGRASGGSGGGAGAAAGMSVAAIVGIVVVILFCCAGGGIALLLPAVQKVREAAARTKDMNNYKQVSLAFHNYNDTYGRLPAADGPVSWRVHLLPFLEQENLYRQFDVTQPWDDGKNRPHADVPVPVFISPSDPGDTKQTHARVFTGPDTLFPPGRPPLSLDPRKGQIPDGTSTTFLVVEARETVPWPQPRELTYSKDGPLPQLGQVHRNGFIFAMADGSVRFGRESTPDAARRIAVTVNDGLALPPDF
jgi:hypothetical protein